MDSVKVGVIMGSKSDWDTMESVSQVLTEFDVHHEVNIISAHRTPDLLFGYASTAKQRGLQVIIAGAGGAAHLPGMCAAKTLLPVLGVPIGVGSLHGIDSLLSIVQMPYGVPVGTLAIGEAGAKNAALLAIQILALHDNHLQQRWYDFREKQRLEAERSEVGAERTVLNDPTGRI